MFVFRLSPAQTLKEPVAGQLYIVLEQLLAARTEQARDSMRVEVN